MTPTFIMALGLVFVIEGLLYALVPGKLRGMLVQLQQASDEQLRMGGAAAIAVGVFIVWLVRVFTG
ncbi:DUF2065 domain-containing protein [Aestuariivirga sp.]|uniref:DUF2065 domain-containing protein n=1 Tax=Aestuariivirga sp. TaxID=2650926 RepID=UPI0039E23FC7